MLPVRLRRSSFTPFFRPTAATAAGRLLRLMLFCFVCALGPAPGVAAIEPSPLDLKLSQSGVVNAILAMPDGSFVIGGRFSSINGIARSNIARLNADGSPFAGFSASTNGTVYALAHDGIDVYVGGFFTSASGYSFHNLCRLNNGTTVDYAWKPEVNGAVYALGYRVTSGYGNNGILYVGGSFASVQGAREYGRFAQFENAYRNLTLATHRPQSANSTVHCITPTANGTYVGGEFSTLGGVARSGGARISDNGNIDAWDPVAIGGISAIIETPSGILVGGSFTRIANTNVSYLAGLNTNGSLLSNWPATAKAAAPVHSLALRDGYVYVGGSATLPQPCFRISASAPYATDTTYQTNINGAVAALATSGNTLLVGGSFTKSKGVVQPSFSRFALTSASLVSTTASGARRNATVSAIIATSDGGVIVGGAFDIAGETVVKNLARFSASAVPQATWTPAANGQVSCLELSGDDLYIGGYFTGVSGVSRSRLAKLSLSTGTVDATWNPGANGEPFALHIAHDKLHVGGNFTELGGAARSRLGRVSLTGAGAVDPAFITDLNGSVRSITSVADHLYVGGEFTAYNGISRAGHIRYNLASGAPDAQWVIPGLTSGHVTAFHHRAPWLYVGGSYSFWGPGGYMIYSICRVETGATAALDPHWRPGISIGASFDFLTSKGDYLYAGGRFVASGAQLGQNPAHINNLARVHLSGKGTSEPLWPGTNSGVYPGAISGNRLFVGGIFTQVGSATRNSSAIIDLNSPLTTSTITAPEAPTQTGALTIAPSGFNSGISHFRVKTPTNGHLFLADGVTPVSDGEFITVANGAAGLVFVPDNKSLTGWFVVHEAKSASVGGIVGSPATVFINVESKLPQTITFDPIGDVRDGDAPRTLVAVASSGGPVTFSAWGAAHVSGNVVTFTGTGAAGVQASQAGSSTHLPATVHQLFTVKGTTRYSEWRERMFGADAANPAVAGDAVDRDGDGVANLLEFAFGSDPTVADKAANRPSQQMKYVDGALRWVITFNRRHSASEPQITYIAEFGQTPRGAWTAQPPTSVIEVDDDWETVTVIDPEPIHADGTGTRFSRVRVSPISH